MKNSKERILLAVDLCKQYHLGGAIHAVVDVNLEVNRGEFVTVVGPSGSGKSTLLGLLGALDTPSSGSVHLGGRDLAHMSSRQLARVRRTDIGFIFQFFHLIPHLTAWENVCLPLRLGGQHRHLRQRAERLLEQVGLGHRLHHMPLQLSGGEQQRVAIARALINEPRVVLADEPTGNLDSKTGREVVELFKELNLGLEQTFVVVTHDVSLSAYATRTVHMEDGRMVNIA